MADNIVTSNSAGRPPIEVRIARTVERLKRLAVTADTVAAKDAAARGALVLEALACDTSLVQRTMRRRFVRAEAGPELYFAGHMAQVFGLALIVDGWPERGGVDWVGTPELIEQAATFAREYLPGFQKAMCQSADDHLKALLPIDVTVVN